MYFLSFHCFHFFLFLFPFLFFLFQAVPGSISTSHSPSFSAQVSLFALLGGRGLLSVYTIFLSPGGFRRPFIRYITIYTTMAPPLLPYTLHRLHYKDLRHHTTGGHYQYLRLAPFFTHIFVFRTRHLLTMPTVGHLKCSARFLTMPTVGHLQCLRLASLYTTPPAATTKIFGSLNFYASSGWFLAFHT